MSPLPLYTHPLYTDGIHPQARFPRERYHMITSRLASLSSAQLELRTAPAATPEELESVHDAAYVRRFVSGEMSDKERRKIGLRPWTPLLIPRTMHIAGGALAALGDALASGGFAANLAGGTHHAHYDWGAGFCVFNDLALCAQRALRAGHVQRLAVLDLDVHQGDGTATLLAQTPEAYTCSVHCEGNFPFHKEESDLDLPLPVGAGDEAYIDAVYQALGAVSLAQPELLLFQAGVDALETDALGRLSVSQEGMRARNELVLSFCVERGIPCVIFMGGGYSKPIEESVSAFASLFSQAALAHQRVIVPQS